MHKVRKPSGAPVTQHEFGQIVGNNIRRVRVERKFSEKAFAKHIGRSEKWIVKVEKGLQPLGVSDFFLIADTLDVCSDRLIEGVR